MTKSSFKLLIAASGTGGHLFPALATAEKLTNCQIEWLGVPERLEHKLLPDQYPLHTIDFDGLQEKPGLLSGLNFLSKLTKSVIAVRKLLKEGQFDGVFTTGGYIGAPAIGAAFSLGLPSILHESNFLPGKVSRLFSPFCTAIGLGFEATADYLKSDRTVCLGTPVRSEFLSPLPLDLPIPANVPVVAIMGGSQGAVGINQLVRKAALAWLEKGIWVVHQTGTKDPDVNSLQHPQYLALPFIENIPGLLKRADLVISRAGASALAEMMVMGKPSILIPFPLATDQHQDYNAKVLADQEAAIVYTQAELTPEVLQAKVLELLAHPDILTKMGDRAQYISVPTSAQQLADLIIQILSWGKKYRK